MPVDPEIARRLLRHGRQHLEILLEYARMSREQFLAERGRMLAVLHALQISIQCLVDLALHICSALGNTPVETYAGAAQALIEKGMLSSRSGQLLRQMAGLRNLIVHGYAALDEMRILDVLENRLVDLAAIFDEIEASLSAHGVFDSD